MEDIKQSIYYTVTQICDNEGKKSNFKVSNEGIAMLSETVLRFADVVAKDLEAFSVHASRKTVNPSDVRLAARRQPAIVSKLDKMISILDEEKKKRKRKSADS